MAQPIYDAIRGMLITLVALLIFSTVSGIERMRYVGAYIAALAASFLFHYFVAFMAARRRHQVAR